MTVVTPSYCPKSARNRCVIEVFGGVLRCPLVFEFSVAIVFFFLGLSQISFFFFLYSYLKLKCIIGRSKLWAFVGWFALGDSNRGTTHIHNKDMHSSWEHFCFASVDHRSMIERPVTDRYAYMYRLSPNIW